MLASKLRFYRIQSELTQQQVANQLNIDRSTYTYYETGKSLPTLETFIKLARVFNVSPDILLDFQPEPLTIVSSNHMTRYNKSHEAPSFIGQLDKSEQDLVLKYRMADDDGKKAITDAASQVNTEPVLLREGDEAPEED